MQQPLRLAALLAAVPLFAWCQAGHWVGMMKVGGQPLNLIVDLAQASGGKWIGTVSMPEMGVNDNPLSQIVVSGNRIRFVQEVPGRPSFVGDLSADKKQITGHMVMGTGNMYLELKYTGQPKVNLPAPSTPITKTLEGTWNATVELSGSVNHLVLKLSHDTGGLGSGTLTNLENRTEHTLSSVTQVGDFVTFEIRALVGTYRGQLNKLGTTITGQWIQNNADRPMVFTKALAQTTSNVAPNLLGTWVAKMDLGEEYKADLILKLSKANNGATVGTFSVSDAKSKDAVVTNIVQKNRSFQFEVGDLKAMFHGSFNASGTEITGTWDMIPIVQNLSLTFVKK